MKLCPRCGGLATYNSYFGAYICQECYWENNSPSEERTVFFTNLINEIFACKKEFGEKNSDNRNKKDKRQKSCLFV